jgi:CheY-like chemotaxis protein
MDKVLIVDDDAQLLTILSETLKRYRNKFHVITAADGLEAIKVLQKQSVSVVVTDIQMPIVNGLVLLAYISRNFPNIRCIIMTGHGTSFLKKRMEQMSLHYVEKPFKIKDLAHAIASMLGRQENLSGTLLGISIMGFLKLIETECITCLCEISSSDSGKGYLLFDEGILHDAFYGNLRGEKAALKLFQMENVTIKFKKPPKRNFPRRIRKRLSALLMEAMRDGDGEVRSSWRRHDERGVTEAGTSSETAEERQKADESLRKAIEGAEIIEMQFSVSCRNASNGSNHE